MAESCDAWRTKVCADAVMEVAAAGAEGAVCFAEVVAAFIEAAEFLLVG